MFLSEFYRFSWAPCRAEKYLITARVSMLSKSCASSDLLTFSLCNKKRLTIQHMNRTLFPTIDSVRRHSVVGQAKEVSATLVLSVCVYWQSRSEIMRQKPIKVLRIVHYISWMECRRTEPNTPRSELVY
jgi:hypothetical protein